MSHHLALRDNNRRLWLLAGLLTPSLNDNGWFERERPRSRPGGRHATVTKTRSSRLRRAIKVAADWCRHHRHEPVAVQHAALSRRIRGHFNYFGVSGNYRSLVPLIERTERNWYKWLRRRSNRTRLTWDRFTELKKQYPLPTPQIRVRIWGP